MLRLATNYFTTAANANTQLFTFVSNDDNKMRHLKSIFVGLTTSGIRVGLYLNGRVYTEVDLTRFAAGDPVVRLELDIPPQSTFQIGLTDLAGAAHTSVPVVIGYSVDG